AVEHAFEAFAIRAGNYHRAPHSVVGQLANLLSEPGEDPALGYVHGPGGHSQPRAHVPGVVSVHGGHPESLPGVRLELVADAVGRPGERLPLVFLVPVVGVRLAAGVLLESLVGIAIARAARVAGPCLQEVVDLVAGNGVEPTAESPFAGVVVQPADGGRD